MDLTLLHGMSLKKLRIHSTKVTDLRPLKGMPLEELRLNATPATDLTPLRGIRSIKFGNALLNP